MQFTFQISIFFPLCTAGTTSHLPLHRVYKFWLNRNGNDNEDNHHQHARPTLNIVDTKMREAVQCLLAAVCRTGLLPHRPVGKMPERPTKHIEHKQVPQTRLRGVDGRCSVRCAFHPRRGRTKGPELKWRSCSLSRILIAAGGRGPNTVTTWNWIQADSVHEFINASRVLAHRQLTSRPRARRTATESEAPAAMKSGTACDPGRRPIRRPTNASTFRPVM